MSTVSIDGLSDAINKTMEQWAGATTEAVHLGINETANFAVKQLQSANPQGSGKYHSWSAYNSGWTASSLRSGRYLSKTVHNAKHYRLTHLLERGHVLANGGRAQAFPHIAPVADECESLLLDNVKKYIQQ